MPRFSVGNDHGNEHAIANEIGWPARRFYLDRAQKRDGFVHATRDGGFRSVDGVPIDAYDGRFSNSDAIYQLRNSPRNRAAIYNA